MKPRFLFHTILASTLASPAQANPESAPKLTLESSINGQAWNPVEQSSLQVLPDGRLWLPYLDQHVQYRLQMAAGNTETSVGLTHKSSPVDQGALITLKQSVDLNQWTDVAGSDLLMAGDQFHFPTTGSRNFWMIDYEEVIPDPTPVEPLQIRPDPDARFEERYDPETLPPPPGLGGYLGQFTGTPPRPIPRPGEDAFNKYIFEERIHQIFEGDVKGYAVVMANEDGFQSTVSGGWARDPADGGRRMTTFRPGNIGSVAKLYSGVALMQLLEARGSDLNTTLDQAIGPFLPQRWLDTIDPAHSQVTFRQLLNHTAGLSDVSVTNNAPVNLRDNPSYFHFTLPPTGVGYNYSNENYRIMTYLIPRLARSQAMLDLEDANAEVNFDTYLDNVTLGYGLEFEAYMRDVFFSQVAGQFAPSADPANDYPAGSTALMYSFPSDTAGLQWSQKEESGIARAQGGYWSTAQELARFMQSVRYTNSLLEPAASSNLLTFPWLITDSSTSNAGFGAELGISNYRFKSGLHPAGDAPKKTGRGLAMFMPYDWVCSAVINSDSVRDGANGNSNSTAARSILAAFFDATRDKPETISREAMRVSTFLDTSAYLRARDMEVLWLDIYDIAGTPFVNATFGKAPEPAAGSIGMNHAEYQNFMNLWVVQKGFAIQQVESYLDQGKIRYAAIITEQDRPEQRAYHGKTYNEHVAKGEEWKDQGFVPVNVSVVSLNGQRRYTAFYEKRATQFSMQTTLDANEYDQQFELLGNQGYKVVSLNAYRHQGERYYAAIWHKQGGEVFGLHEADRDAYRAADAGYLNNSTLPAIITGVDSGNAAAATNERHRFGAIWR